MLDPGKKEQTIAIGNRKEKNEARWHRKDILKRKLSLRGARSKTKGDAAIPWQKDVDKYTFIP